MPSRAGLFDDRIAPYERDGAVLIKGALDGAALALLEAGVEEARRSQGKRFTTVAPTAGSGQTTVWDYASQDSPSLRALLERETIGTIAAALMRTDSCQLVLDQIFYKSGGPIVATPWHQDTPFLRVRGEQLVRLWMPRDASPSALTVQVVRGSHRWNVVYDAAGTKPDDDAVVGAGGKDRQGVGDRSRPAVPDVRRHRDSFDIVGWDVAPGDVLAFQGNMLHGTDGHPGWDSPRRAFAVLLGGPDLRYHAPTGKAFPSPGRMRGLRPDDAIADGAPIGDHPDAFPVIWRAPAMAAA